MIGQSLRRLGLVWLLAAAVRWALFSAGFQDSFSSSYEIITPITSFKRLKEGLWLVDQGTSPYLGSAFHHIPLALALFYPFQHAPAWIQSALFVGLDLIAGLLLWLAVASYRRPRHDIHEAKVLNEDGTEASSARPHNIETQPQSSVLGPSPSYLPELAALLFLLNPMTIATCVAQSLQTVENALVIATVCAAVCGKFVLASILLGLLINFSPYYVTILVPLAWVVQESKHLAWKDSQNKLESSTAITSSALSIVKTISFIASSAIFAAAFLFVSFLLAGSQTWEFFWKSYGFFYTAEDLTPNLGLFWYFFTEMFDHFRAFFIFVTQYHVFIYVIPLCIRFKKYPMAVLWGQIAIICAFKAYPSAGDVSLYWALAPLIAHLLSETSYTVFLGIVWIYVIVLLPVMWRMWVWTGTGNANFYYALNLVIALAQSMLIVDALSSVLKRDFLIFTKLKEKKDAGKSKQE